MENKYNIKNENSIYKTIFVSILIGTIVFVILLPLFALIVTLLDLDISSTGPLASICIGISSAISGYIAARKIKRKGIVIGGLCGLIIFFLIKLISLLINSSGITLITFIHLIIIVLSGCIGGIIGVNSGEKRKII